MSAAGITASEFRVRYAETDQMEAQGLRLPVVDARVRYRAAALYEDLVRVRCWVRDVSSRRVIFGYAVERCADGRLLATAQTSLMAVDSHHERTTIPQAIRHRLVAVPDPVRL